MAEIETDSRGRVTIPKRLRDRFGDRFRLVELSDGIKLVPIPEDPVAALRNAGSEQLREASVEELREAGVAEGTDQAEEHVR